MKYINTYNTDTEYYNDNTKLFPNVSYVKDIDEVKWRRLSPNMIVAKFVTTGVNRVITISNKQQLFSEITIDGVSQTIGTEILQHTFATAGEHEVVYKLIDQTSIGGHAFQSCVNMESITLPNTITSIGTYAFSGCHFTSIEIPSLVTTIGDLAFDYCNELLTLTLPSLVTTIGNSAFYACTGLTSITSLNTTPPTLGTDVFFNVPATCTIYVPAASVNAYKAAGGWSDRADYIQPIQ